MTFANSYQPQQVDGLQPFDPMAADFPSLFTQDPLSSWNAPENKGSGGVYGNSDWLSKYYDVGRSEAKPDWAGEFTGTPAHDIYNLKAPYADALTFKNRFGKAAPTGPMTLEDLTSYTGGDHEGVTAGEFSSLSADVQQAILNDPNTFLRGQLGLNSSSGPLSKYAALANKGGSGDLLSVGAQGGSNDLGKLSWAPGVGLVQDPSNYINITHQHGFQDVLGSMAPAAFAVALNAMGVPIPVTGAMMGATNASEHSPDGSFGDILKGAVTGGATAYAGQQLGGMINDQFNSLADSATGYNPAIADSIWSDSAYPGMSAYISKGIGALSSMAAKQIIDPITGKLTPTYGSSQGTPPTTTGPVQSQQIQGLSPLAMAGISLAGQGINPSTTPQPVSQLQPITQGA